MANEFGGADDMIWSYFENSPDVVFILDKDKRIIFFNKNASKYILSDSGKSVESGDSIYSFISPTLVASFDLHFHKTLNGEPIERNINVFNPVNDKWWSVSYQPIYKNEDITAVSITISDITTTKKTERQHEEISNVSRVGGWEADYINNTNYWSPVTKQIIDLPEDYPVGMYSALDFYKEGADRETVKQAIREALATGKGFDLELQAKTATGKIIWTRTKGKTESHNGKVVRLYGTFQDTTEKRSIYEDLLISQQYYKSLFEQNPNAVFALDLNEKFISVNENAALLAESTVPEMLGSSFAPYCPEEEVARVMENFNKTQKGISISYDCGFITAKGNRKEINITNLPIIINGVVVAIYAIAKDISESISAKNQLEKSEANLRTVFDNTDIGYVLLTDSFKIVSFNNHAQAYILSKHQPPLKENEYMTGTVDDARSIDIAEVQDNVRKGKKVIYERNIKSSGNDDQWYNITFHPVSGMQNEVLGIIMEIENITARKKSELELNKSFNLLNEQNKRLLNFSYIISHNLRSHTSNIKSILTFLEDAENEDEKVEMMEHLKNVSNSLDETIHNLNDVVSINNSVNLIYRPLFLIEFISKATDVLKEQIIQKKVIIDNKLLIDTSVNFNPAFLESIMLNFLSNAIKYSHPDRRPVITLDSYLDNGQFVLIIADNGIGIDLEKNGDKLFGFYKTFNGNSDARGLGLFICKNQVEYMGGKIEVESELGRGTTFKIFFK
ncbi:PAS domain-containing sensor histidine kinase [Flavipsychrobacter stenotrophus]|nr:PAS domain-containing sensor histidine kinase [Flavipsychrobacter stenotrophus]